MTTQLQPTRTQHLKQFSTVWGLINFQFINDNAMLLATHNGHFAILYHGELSDYSPNSPLSNMDQCVEFPLTVLTGRSGMVDLEVVEIRPVLQLAGCRTVTVQFFSNDRLGQLSFRVYARGFALWDTLFTTAVGTLPVGQRNAVLMSLLSPKLFVTNTELFAVNPAAKQVVTQSSCTDLRVRSYTTKDDTFIFSDVCDYTSGNLTQSTGCSKELQTYPARLRVIVAYSPDGSTMVSYNNETNSVSVKYRLNGDLLYSSLADQQAATVIFSPTVGQCAHVVVSPDGRFVLFVSVLGFFRMLKLELGGLPSWSRNFFPTMLQLRSIQFSPDGRYILIADGTSRVYTLDAFDGSPVDVLQHTQDDFIVTARFSRDSCRVVTGSTEGNIYIW